jgi:hypothetical protein
MARKLVKKEVPKLINDLISKFGSLAEVARLVGHDRRSIAYWRKGIKAHDSLLDFVEKGRRLLDD